MRDAQGSGSEAAQTERSEKHFAARQFQPPTAMFLARGENPLRPHLMTSPSFLRFFSVFAWMFFLSPAFGRVWTSKEGVTFEAELVEATPENATLVSPKLDEPLVVPINELAISDQVFVRAWLAEQVREEALVSQMHPYQRRQYELQKATRDIEDNFEAPWPGIVSAPDDLEITELSSDPSSREYVYHSPHFEFVCDVPLKKNLVKRFAVLFEASREYCRQLPISSKKAQVAGTRHRNRILLFEKKESYVAAGGPPSSAGVYIPSKDIVMVPLTSLGVKKVGSSYSIDYKRENTTLAHELAHQLTDHYYFRSGAGGWFSEGLAEYIAVTPYRSGSFNVKKALNAIRGIRYRLRPHRNRRARAG